MTSKKKGFAGFSDLVSDISEVTSPDEKPYESAASSPQPTPSPPLQQQPKAALAAQSTQPPPADSGSSRMRWVMGIIAVVVVILITASVSKNNQSSSSGGFSPSPSYSPSPSKPTVSQYEQAIQEIDPQVARLLDGMLDAAQSKDFPLIAKNAQIIERQARQKAAQDKVQLKESRSQNAIGLKALKDHKKEVAVQNFFASYKLNNLDAEVAENFGIGLYEIGDLTAAKKAIFASLAMTPKRSYAWVSLGRLFARSNEPVQASNAFSLGFQFAKSPKAMRQSVLSLFRKDENYAVKNAAQMFLVDSYSTALPEFIRPTLGNLSDVKIPVLLPTKVTSVNSEGAKMELTALNNELFQLEAGPDWYKIPFGSEPNCEAMYCAVGVISGQRVSAADQLEVGEPVELINGISGKIVRDAIKNTSKLVFRLANVQYTISLSADAVNDISAVNSALSLGPIPVEVFSGESRIASVAPSPIVLQQPAYSRPSQPYSAPAPAYTPPPAANPGLDCDVAYNISLQTFGEGVTVELRKGTPGNSSTVNSSQSFGGNVRFGNLCPGSYFLAIGNGDSVSVTPVRQFERGVDYTSTLTMQRGAGNVSTRRKGDL
jgi:tetratricopeptide (TPR) repeat protein